MQFQSDLIGSDVVRPRCIETTALGAAYLAGLSTGVWKDREEISKLWLEDVAFEPKMAAEDSEKLIKNWHRAVERSRGWAR